MESSVSVIHAAQAGQGGPVTIACIDKATADLGLPFNQLTASLQKCYDEYFLPIWGGAVAICVGIDFSAISSVTRLPHQAARSMI